MATQTIYRLTTDWREYEDSDTEAITLGVFASRELAERFLVRHVLAGHKVEGAEIVTESLVIDDIDDDSEG